MNSSINLKTYSSPKAIETYTRKEGLFPVEEEILATYVFRNGTILDLGCGTGRTTKWLHDNGHHVIGLDNSKPMIQRATELHPDISFMVGDAINLKLPSKSFDCVLFSFNGLDYLYPEKFRFKALREIYRVLRKDGLFIFSSHNRLWLYLPSRRRFTKIRLFKNPYHIEKTVYGELVTYSITHWNQKKQLQKHGFETLQTLRGFTEPWIYYVARRVQQ